MKRNYFYSIVSVFIIAALFVTKISFGQNTIDAGPDDTICPPGSATLTASVSITTGLNGTALTLSDDEWSGVIPLGFNFTFFGNTYSNIVVGSNNILTFDASQAGGYCQWPINNAIPSSADPMNSIMCPWEDLYPPAGGTEVYTTTGTAPNRIFIVSYCSTPMYSCTNLLFTGSVMLYETSNIIEMHTANKYVCSWNGSYAIQGIQNATGTIAYVVPGRNYPSVYTLTNDGYQFTPTGPTTYSQGAIPYAPIILNSPVGAIQWYVGSTLVGTGPSITVSPSSTTQYVALIGGCAGVASDTVNVVVQTLSVNAGVDDTICPSQLTQLNATSPYPVTTWSWLPTTGLSNPNIANPTASPATTTTYTVTATNGSCTATDIVVVNVINSLTLIASQVNLTCNSNCNGSATVNVTSGNPPYTYSWAPSGGTGATASNLCAGTYSCTISASVGCVVTQTFTITQPTALAAPVSMTSVLCNGGNTGTATVAAAGGTPAYTYSWSPSGGTGATASNLNTGIYSCTVTDANGCTVTSTINVTQPAALSVVASTSSPAICFGFPATLTATTTGGTPAYTIAWTPGVLPSGSSIVVSPSTSTTYTTTVTDLNGCTTTSSINVNVNPLPVAVLTSDTVANCTPACINFMDNSTVPAPNTIVGWHWDYGDNGVATSQNPSHCYTTAGTYSVTLIVTSSTGCVDTLIMPNYITATPRPIASFDHLPKPVIEEYPTVSFHDLSVGAINSWYWVFLDSSFSTSNIQNPTYTFPPVGCFNVSLRVVTTDGCVDSTMGEICVIPDPVIYVPNAFTPNGNGLNDVFMPEGHRLEPDQYHMWIFDRWGNLLWETTDLSKGWDGHVQGKSEVCEVDTYVYKISAVDISGAKHNLIGKVSLVK